MAKKKKHKPVKCPECGADVADPNGPGVEFEGAPYVEGSTVLHRFPDGTTYLLNPWGSIDCGDEGEFEVRCGECAEDLSDLMTR